MLSPEHVTPPKTELYQETTQNYYSQNQQYPNHQFQNHQIQNQHSKNNQNQQNSIIAAQNLQNFHNNHVRRTPSNISNVSSNRSEQGRKTNILRKNSSGGKAENKRPYVKMRPKTNSRGPHKSVGVNCNNLLGDEGETEDFEKYNYGENENENENRPNSQMYRVFFFKCQT